MKSSALTPYLTRFGDLIQSLYEGVLCCFVVERRFGSGMVQLDQSRPQSSSCEVNLKTLFHYLLSLSEETISDFHHYCFKEELPFSSDHALCTIHYLPRLSDIPFHFKKLSVIKEGDRHLLGGHFLATPLYQSSCSLYITEAVFDTRTDHPYFPTQIIRTIED